MFLKSQRLVVGLLEGLNAWRGDACKAPVSALTDEHVDCR